jgi:hypothetical protein
VDPVRGVEEGEAVVYDATHLLAGGHNIPTVREPLGHRAATSSMIYTHPEPRGSVTTRWNQVRIGSISASFETLLRRPV